MADDKTPPKKAAPKASVKPQVGQTVQYTPCDDHGELKNSNGKFAAIIAGVAGTTVNVWVFHNDRLAPVFVEGVKYNTDKENSWNYVPATEA